MTLEADMAQSETHPAQDSGELDEALLRAISHPLRHRLLGMLDGRTASPNMLARELGLPLGRVSYHIRLLSDLGAIELVRTEPRRGALEHFYRAVTTVWFSEADWQKLPRSARRGILGQNLQHIFSSVTAAADSGGFDREASVVLRAPLELDEQGLSELSALLRETVDGARDINTRAAQRRGSGETTDSVPTELSILHYEQRRP
jgi:DNA-binding transcriptional ArsR family regulator